MSDETLEQAADRLIIIAQDIKRRFNGNEVVLPVALPNSLHAAMLILDRLFSQTQRHGNSE